METVVAFNSELSGLYDSKPPISKAKMASITRAAMKAIKFYKHVVQSVEKFILKCKPEYKIPGLYVIDSIVRQSRHQFGSEKDVFAPRFARNMKQTFANLFRCSPEDKSRIIRVLNLWQKNSVFAPEVIQPLFDLADPNNPIYQTMPSLNNSMQDISASSNGLNISGEESSHNMDDLHSKTVDLTAASGHQTANSLDQSTIRQLQQLQQILMRQTNESMSSSGVGGGGVGVGSAGISQSDSIKFNKKLLDYDYGDEEEEDKSTSHAPNLLDGNNLTQLLKDPNVLRQLQTLQKLKQQEEKQMKLNEMRLQEEAFEKHLQNVLKASSGMPGMQSGNEMPEKELEFINKDGSSIEVINLDGNDSQSPTPDRDRYKMMRRRSSRSRSPRDARGRDRRRRSTSRLRSSRSRSRAGSRSPRSNRRRNSRERGKDKEREKEKEKEYERERRRKGLPDLKRDHLSVCSTTLWVGHLSKLVQQEELSDSFGKYGDIVSIDMIHPRGCAFIVMNRRQDAHKAMGGLKNYKMQGRAITISWAAGKGVKSKEWKDYWDLDLGVSYIPWDRLTFNTDLVALEEGGMFDEDSMPEWMKDKLTQKKDTSEKIMPSGIFGVDNLPPLDTSQPPPAPAGMMPGVPMVPPFPLGPVPRLMPPMGVPLPGSMVPGMVPGMPMPPNIVPGMPPPHMLPPPAGMVPGFGPIPPPMDKSVPPPSVGGDGSGASMPFMPSMPLPPPFPNIGLPPQFGQPPQQPNHMSLPTGGNQNDDHMDIEMEDDMPMNMLKPPPMNFNQPPPMFPPPSFNMPDMSALGGERNNDQDDRGGRDNRERNDFSNRGDRGSRWGNNDQRDRSRDREMQPHDRNDNSDDIRPDFTRRPIQHDQMNQAPPPIWRENGPGTNFQPPNFGGLGGGVGGNAGGDRRGPGAPPSMLGLDIPPPQRPPPDFFDGRRDNNFGMDDRRGGGGGQQRDFFQNQGNRFAPQQMGPGMGRGNQMPMRGGPPQPPFGPRLGPMFMRPSRPPGFNNNMGNDRPPFDRDERGGGNSGGGGGRMRGNNNMDRRQGNNNWRDDDENGNNGGRRPNRFRDRDNDNKGRGDRFDRGDNNRNDRKNDRKAPTPPPLNVMSTQDNEEDWDDLPANPPKPPMLIEDTSQDKRNFQREVDTRPLRQPKVDTEEDWDSEIVEHKVADDFEFPDEPIVPRESEWEENDDEPSKSPPQKRKSEDFDIFESEKLQSRHNISKSDSSFLIDPNDFSIPGPPPKSDTPLSNEGMSLYEGEEDILTSGDAS